MNINSIRSSSASMRNNGGDDCYDNDSHCKLHLHWRIRDDDDVNTNSNHMSNLFVRFSSTRVARDLVRCHSTSPRAENEMASAALIHQQDEYEGGSNHNKNSKCWMMMSSSPLQESDHHFLPLQIEIRCLPTPTTNSIADADGSSSSSNNNDVQVFTIYASFNGGLFNDIVRNSESRHYMYEQTIDPQYIIHGEITC